MKPRTGSGVFILVEGLDGAGKTTAIFNVIHEAGEEYRFVYCKGMGGNNFWGRQAKRFAKTSLFMAELLWVTQFPLRKALSQGQVIIMDKYYFFVASHIPDVNTWFNKLLLKIFAPLMVKPDLLIYFELSFDDRVKRLKSDPSEFHQRLIDNPEWVKERERVYLKNIREAGMPLVFLDSTGCDEAQTARMLNDKIIAFLQKER